MFDKLTIEFKADDLITHFEHISPPEGMLPCATDENCTVCKKLIQTSRHVPALKNIFEKPKKKLE